MSKNMSTVPLCNENDTWLKQTLHYPVGLEVFIGAKQSFLQASSLCAQPPVQVELLGSICRTVELIDLEWSNPGIREYKHLYGSTIITL